MQKITFYHNPRCSKSRQALELLRAKGIEPILIEYLKTPLAMAELRQLSTHFELSDFVRTEEKIFKELHLSLDNKEKLLEIMHQEPILMQRPIAVFKGKAVICRPPAKVLELIEASKI